MISNLVVGTSAKLDSRPLRDEIDRLKRRYPHMKKLTVSLRRLRSFANVVRIFVLMGSSKLIQRSAPMLHSIKLNGPLKLRARRMFSYGRIYRRAMLPGKQCF